MTGGLLTAGTWSTPTLATYTAKREDLVRSAEALFDVVAKGAVTIRMNQSFALRDAAEAHRLGLVNRVVPAEQVMPVALALARRIAQNGPVAVQRVKQTVLQASGLPLAAGYRLEDESRRVVFDTEDAREGPRAFMEKRAPRYRGR